MPRWQDVVTIDPGARVGDNPILTMAKSTVKLGGARPGSGRKSAFPGKDLGRVFGMDFTPDGRKALRALERRTKLSRNDIMAHLALAHADELTFDVDGTVYPGKLAKNVMSIRLPPNAGEKLQAARERTGKGFSDIGEALVRLFGDRLQAKGKPRKARRTVAATESSDDGGGLGDEVDRVKSPEAWMEGLRIVSVSEFIDADRQRWRELTLSNGSVVQILLTHPWLIIPRQ